MKRSTAPAVVVGVIGVLALSVAGVGVATAANGGSLVLGHSNTATHTTTLADSRGTPLALKAKPGHPPLTVNSKALVKHLNADELDGSSASGLATSGGGASTHFGKDERGIVGTTPTFVARTGVLAKGTYYVSAAASGSFSDSADGLACFVATHAPTAADQNNASQSTTTGDGASVPVVAVVTVKAKQQITLFCYTEGLTGTPETEIAQAGITAIRVAHSAKGATLPGAGVA
jgi:hypothetical protein